MMRQMRILLHISLNGKRGYLNGAAHKVHFLFVLLNGFLKTFLFRWIKSVHFTPVKLEQISVKHH